MSGDNSNYPAGVNNSHPHFNPDTCRECGEVATPGEKCPECGEYVMTEQDYADEAADAAFDQMRDEGLI